METKGTLLSVRPDVRVVDATVRDGGLVNDFRFTDEFVKNLYHANIKAGVDYMEFGYKASTDIFPMDEFGPWKFCREHDIRRIVGDNDSDMKIAVMADVGRTDFRRDIIDRSDSVIDLIRIATYINTIPAAIEMVEYCHEKGYETTVNIMAISNDNDRDIDEALELIGQSPADGIYIVDSYGAIYPEQMRLLADKYLSFAEKYDKFVGIHAHNNQQLAFANTIEAVGDGVDWLDATYASMGRGAGNCAMELLLGFLRNPKYNVYHAIQFVDSYMNGLKEDGVRWGYDLQYLMTGLLNQHPRAAIQFTKEGRTDYTEFYREIVAQD